MNSKEILQANGRVPRPCKTTAAVLKESWSVIVTWRLTPLPELWVQRPMSGETWTLKVPGGIKRQ